MNPWRRAGQASCVMAAMAVDIATMIVLIQFETTGVVRSNVALALLILNLLGPAFTALTTTLPSVGPALIIRILTTCVMTWWFIEWMSDPTFHAGTFALAVEVVSLGLDAGHALLAFIAECCRAIVPVH